MLNDAARYMVVNWEHQGLQTVRQLHEDYLRYHHDPRFAALIMELTDGSAFFRACWTQRGPARVNEVIKVFIHPVLGRLTCVQVICDTLNMSGFRIVAYPPADEATAATFRTFDQTMQLPFMRTRTTRDALP